jgi:hypothetical protein
MPKKVKSFAMEGEPYEELFQIFKDSYAEVNISYCMNKYVKDFLRYLKPIQETLKKSPEYNVPLSFIIETTAREPLFKFLDDTPSQGMTESSLNKELRNFQEKYDEHIKKNPPAKQINDLEELGKKHPIAPLIELLRKAMVEDIKNFGRIPDDRYREIALETGGMDLVKFIKEKLVPAFDKIDPDLKDVKKKLGKNLKRKDKKDI